MRETAEEKRKPWNPSKFKCVKCDDIIWSKYPGEFVSCKCNECFVDQTRYYMRSSGNLELFEMGTDEE